MNNQLFIENPHMEWHNNIPFALARLNVNYAQYLAKLALRYENKILSLPFKKGPDTENWVTIAKENPISARFRDYNIFFLDPAYLFLLNAIRKMYYFFLDNLNTPQKSVYMHAWMNIHRTQQCLGRHSHGASRQVIIGSFQANAEGSNTRYGLSEKIDINDHVFHNQDGMLLMTLGAGNYHETSIWENPNYARISYAYEIIDSIDWQSNLALFPFDVSASVCENIPYEFL